MDEATETYLENLTNSTVHILVDNLVGIYLHGSAVLGGYISSRSDLDILIAVHNPLTTTEQSALSRALSQECLPCPAAKGLEMSVVLANVASGPYLAEKVPFEMHITTAKEDRKIVYGGAEHEGDEDLVLHFWVTRERGRVLYGKNKEEVFKAVDWGLVRRQMRRELEWARREAAGEYVVLNAARALGGVRSGRVMGKIEGGEWALENLEEGWKMVLEWALRRQRGGEVGEEVDEGGVDRFVCFVMEEICQ